MRELPRLNRRCCQIFSHTIIWTTISQFTTSSLTKTLSEVVRIQLQTMALESWLKWNDQWLLKKRQVKKWDHQAVKPDFRLTSKTLTPNQKCSEMTFLRFKTWEVRTQKIKDKDRSKASLFKTWLSPRMKLLFWKRPFKLRANRISFKNWLTLPRSSDPPPTWTSLERWLRWNWLTMMECSTLWASPGTSSYRQRIKPKMGRWEFWNPKSRVNLILTLIFPIKVRKYWRRRKFHSLKFLSRRVTQEWLSHCTVLADLSSSRWKTTCR